MLFSSVVNAKTSDAPLDSELDILLCQDLGHSLLLSAGGGPGGGVEGILGGGGGRRGPSAGSLEGELHFMDRLLVFVMFGFVTEGFPTLGTDEVMRLGPNWLRLGNSSRRNPSNVGVIFCFLLKSNNQLKCEM